MKRREMILKTLQLGAISVVANPVKFFANEKRNAILAELTGNALRFPPVFTNGETMTLGNSLVNVWPGQSTQVNAINGSYLGPSVFIQKGSTFNANFINQLSEPATIHWHGLSVPELMDGHPKDAILPGGSYTYTFPVNQKAGTFFYHAHAHMITAKQVYKGFGGFFIIEDPAEIQLGLPRGAYDVPLCIQDRRFADIPQFIYDPTMMEMMMGFLGDIVLVNGTPDAYFEVSKTLYRFRLLNGSNSRVYKIGFSDGRQFQVIATDGGLKDLPVQTNSFYLSPGERVDILFDFSSYSIGQNVTFKSLQFDSSVQGSYTQGTEMNLLRFDITGNSSSGGIVPAALAPINYYNPSEVTTHRTFTLTMSQMTHWINGLKFEMNRIDWETPLNSLEEWEIINTTMEFHPMHIHGVQFQVYSRNEITNLPPNDKGWKDTVLINPYERVKLLVKFTDYRGIYLFHCHNLEHEDDGMMLNFKIVNPVGINEGNSELPEDYELYQNFPNPFNPSTEIKFSIPQDSNIELKVYDQLGREVRTLIDDFKKAGTHSVKFEADNLSSGEYFYKLISGKASIAKKMLLIK